ncbi:MAG: hypothetical protein IT280_06315 [Ignavibacteria bacterium]|nr:hypothetical protein [Ignavibacteria bacterium]
MKETKPGKELKTEKEIFEINPAILCLQLGYSSIIDGDNITVVADKYGEQFNSRNEKIRVITEPGYVIINGKRTTSGKFEGLTAVQLYQLAAAGVLLLNSKQQTEFRKKFF